MLKSFKINLFVTKWVPSITLLVVALVFAASTWYESAEEAGVREAVGHYIDGAASAKASDFEKAFAVDVADIKSVWKDPDTDKEIVTSRPVKDAIKAWTKDGPGKSWGKVVDVRIVDDKLAHATVELEFQGWLYVDVMSLYKVNDEWKIVGKTYVSRGRAEGHRPSKIDE